MNGVELVAPRSPIRPLSAELVARIAAGEVVERPASVVKELVENAVDAGATEVRVALRDGGLESIEVDDDGLGIPEEELPLAIERHATSKLTDPETLGRVRTLGFRGEALAAIAAVSRLRILSRTPGSDAAHGISVVGGQLVGRFVEGRAPGTSVQVHDLFFNTPARRKFLRSPAAELVEVTATVERLYLARPSVGLTLVSEGKETARFPSTGRLVDAAVRVLGEEFVGHSFTLEATVPHGAVEGVLGVPGISRSGTRSIHLGVNGRAVSSRTLSQAVRTAFGDYIPRDRFPVGVLHLTLDLSRVDVNVHPTKREVRIAGERELAEALRRAVRSALLQIPQVAERPDARSTPEPKDSETSTELSDTGSVSGGWGTVGPEVDLPAAVQRRLTAEGSSAVVAGTGGHPPLSLVGCLFQLYWVAESDGQLVLIDQHAASERVVFDALRASGKLGRQELVVPLRIGLTARQRSALDANEGALSASGFAVEPFGAGEVRVRAVPSYRGRLARAQELPALLDEIAEGGRPTIPDDLEARRAASVACHAAVRGGESISAEEMGRILQSLYALEGPAYACPHGRPILVRLPRPRIDRWFLRPGGAK